MKQSTELEKNKKENTDKQKVFTIPNILSFIRILLIPIIIWLYCAKENYLWTAYILIISGITDIVDGFIARKFNMVSDLGKIIDPVADKFTQGAALICLLFRFPLIWIPLAVMIMKETFNTITGILVIKKAKIVPSSNWHGKAATVLLYIMIVAHLFWYDLPSYVSLGLIIACTIMVTISFVLYGIRYIGLIKNAETTREH